MPAFLVSWLQQNKIWYSVKKSEIRKNHEFKINDFIYDTLQQPEYFIQNIDDFWLAKKVQIEFLIVCH